MLLGEGKRKVGEACWSHAQCTRSQPNAHCYALICTCDSGFHNHDGKCSRNVWEDLGLAQWELILVALVLTLLAFTVFVGIVYCVIARLVRFRKTSPSDALTSAGSLKDEDGSIKKQGSIDGSTKNIRVYETKLVDNSTVESQLVEEGTAMFHNDSVSTVSQISEPVRFIVPLGYRSSNSDTWQSSLRSNSSQRGMRRSRGMGRRQLIRAWSTTSSTTPTNDDSDDWFQPNRSHFRRLGPHSPASTTRLPLLLRASTFSESDESP